MKEEKKIKDEEELTNIKEFLHNMLTPLTKEEKKQLLKNLLDMTNDL